MEGKGVTSNHSPKSLKRKRWLRRILIVFLALIVAQILHQVFQNEEKSLRTRIREGISDLFPDQAGKLKAAYGIKPYSTDSPAAGNPPWHRNVVLVHGLDDPGRVWMNLAPRLVKAGYRVWIMSYPNDQPITDSARLFLGELETLRKKDVASIDVVSHSMGGLVTREMLTNPKMAFVEKAGIGAVPEVKRLVMVGPPNHGSQMARFRLLAEVRDQLVLLWQRKHHWLQSVVDGTGEAGIDLLPGSRFLETLNQRPLPNQVDMLVIAGMLTPWQVRNLENKIESTRRRLSEKETDILDTLTDHLNAMADGIGDGLVTVDSARLPGVPLRIVAGTHVSIIRNLTRDNPREPPAIPIILKKLSDEPGAGS